jgi:hypothetical protein
VSASTFAAVAPAPSAAAAAPSFPAIVQSLTRARSAAFGAATGQSPAGFDVPGSPAWSADHSSLAQLHAAGVRYRDLEMAIVQTRLLSSDDRRAQLLLTYRTSAYDVVDAAGTTLNHRSAGAPRTVQLSLARSADGWRVVRFG